MVLGAYDGHDVETAMAFAQEFHLKVILSHVTRAQDVLDKIASYHVPVIVGPIFDLPEANERYDAVYSLPGELQKRGVKVILASYNVSNSRNLPYSAGFAVAYGLPYDEAMKSITLNPAEAFGLGDKLGSLDVGQDCERRDCGWRSAGCADQREAGLHQRRRDSDGDAADAAAG